VPLPSIGRVLAVILRLCLHIVRDIVKLGMYLINIRATAVQTGDLQKRIDVNAQSQRAYKALKPLPQATPHRTHCKGTIFQQLPPACK
jgi:hypothetical protein